MEYNNKNRYIFISLVIISMIVIVIAFVGIWRGYSNPKFIFYEERCYDIPGDTDYAKSIALNSDGTELYVYDTNSDSIYQYDCTSAWNLSSCEYNSSYGNLTSEDKKEHTDNVQVCDYFEVDEIRIDGPSSCEYNEGDRYGGCGGIVYFFDKSEISREELDDKCECIETYDFGLKYCTDITCKDYKCKRYSCGDKYEVVVK